MVTSADILFGGMLPAVAAVAAFTAVHWLLLRREPQSGLFGPATAWSAAIVVGYVAGAFALRAREAGAAAALEGLRGGSSALDQTARVVCAAVYPALLAALAAVMAPSGWLRRVLFGLAVVLGVLVPARALYLSFDGGKYLPSQQVRASGFGTDAWSAAEAMLVLGGVTLGVLAVWAAWLRQPREEQPIVRGILATGVLVAASLVAALTGSFTYGQALGVLAAAAGGATVAAWLHKTPAGPEAAAGPVLVTLGVLLALTTHYSATPAWQAILLSVAALVAVGRLPRVGAALRCALVVVLAGVPLGKAIADFAATQQQEASLESYYGS